MAAQQAAEAALASKADAATGAAAAAEREAAVRAELAATAQQLHEARSQLAATEAFVDGAPETCSAQQAAQQLWQQRPELVAAAAAVALAGLAACMATAAWLSRQRGTASATPAAAIDSKQLARLQRQLEQAQRQSEDRIAAFQRAQAAQEVAERRLGEAKQWEAAAAQLAQSTAEASAAAAGPLSARAPLSARSSNHLGGNNSAPSLAAVPPLVLPAGKADTPATWLDLLQQRWAALGAAAIRAGAAADEAIKEQAWGEEKVRGAGIGLLTPVTGPLLWPSCSVWSQAG